MFSSCIFVFKAVLAFVTGWAAAASDLIRVVTPWLRQSGISRMHGGQMRWLLGGGVFECGAPSLAWLVYAEFELVVAAGHATLLELQHMHMQWAQARVKHCRLCQCETTAVRFYVRRRSSTRRNQQGPHAGPQQPTDKP